MTFSPRKTWSQETLAVKRHIDGVQDSRFLTLEKRTLLVLAVKTAMAAGISDHVWDVRELLEAA